MRRNSDSSISIQNGSLSFSGPNASTGTTTVPAPVHSYLTWSSRPKVGAGKASETNIDRAFA
jgi:hypothetical protein